MKNQRSFILKRFFIGGIICFMICSTLIAQNKNEQNGYWKFVNVEEKIGDPLIDERAGSKSYTTGGLGNYKYNSEYKGYGGMFFRVSAKWNAPPNVLTPGEPFEFSFGLSVSDNSPGNEWWNPGGTIGITDYGPGTNPKGLRDGKHGTSLSLSRKGNEKSKNGTLSIVPPSSKDVPSHKESENVYYMIRVWFGQATAHYFYQWQQDENIIKDDNIVQDDNNVIKDDNNIVQDDNQNIEDKKLRQAIKATPSQKELKPDGISTSEIEAILYEYIPDDPNSSKPLSNKKVTFSIPEQYGITPGTLSTYEAYTDAYGRAKVIYTSPDANSISNQNILTATVVARCDEYNAEDIAYLHFRFDRGGVNVEPNMKGVVSNYGIVPPDKRYPAKISAYLEDDGGHKKTNTNVTFSLSGNKTYGLLRTPTGQTGTSVSVTSDANGFAEVEYFYDSDVLPDNDAMETIDIKADGLSNTLKAYIYIGLNLVIESAVSGYEGKGIINAYEEVPVKIKLKSLRYPDVDVNKFLYHWSNPGLRVNLEIKPQGNVPGYLLDKLKLEKHPLPEFNEIVSLKSFEDKKEYNYLWISEYSLLSYQGYPKITPTISGQTNYQISVSLVDDNGQPLSNDIQQKAFISIETGLPADAFSIFFLENPFGPHTDQAVFFRTVLDLAGYGLLLNIADAASAINKGNVTDLVGTVLSALKDVMLDKAKLNSDLIKTYTELAYTEKIASLALGELLIAKIENALISKIASLSTWGDKILIVLNGNGSQKLLDAKTNLPVPVQENSITADDNLKTVSIKNGNVSVYLVPPDLDYKLENYTKKIEHGKKK